MKNKDLFLAVKRNASDDLYPGAWEFPGGHLEVGELLKDGLKRELREEIGFEADFEPKIIYYYDEIKNNNDELIHNIEIDFIIDVDRDLIDVKLSEER